MATLTNSNLYSEGDNLIKSFLEGISGLDPKNRFKANWINSSFPNVNAKGFDGYPFIIVRTDVSEKNKSFSSVVSEKIFRTTISIYGLDASDVDSISDSIFGALKDETKLTQFSVKDLASSPFNWDLDEHGKKIIWRDIAVILRKRI